MVNEAMMLERAYLLDVLTLRAYQLARRDPLEVLHALVWGAATRSVTDNHDGSYTHTFSWTPFMERRAS